MTNAADAAERMRIDSSGNVLVGTTSSNGAVSNATKVVGGIFNSVNGVGAITTSPTTVITLPSLDGATYIFSCQNISDAGGNNYGATAFISQQTTSLAQSDIKTASYTLISISGLAIRITSTLATKTYKWSLIRIL
jgi:Zn-dependent alcohol dehydrogenase